MAQWSTADRTLQAKIVYYGPACGGKTTNLESLHRITDPGGANQLISLRTADDRTLFFDLLPFDLGEILGHRLQVKLYTVPGQVRYDTTRQIVLAGADAVVFVADSCRTREDQNRWSLQNLKMNLRSNRLDPASVPLLFQFNKQDLDDAASPELVARWFGIRVVGAIPAVATEGRGVVETFLAATRALLAAWVAGADERTRGEIDLEGLGQALDRRFAPYLGDRASRSDRPAGPVQRVVLREEDLLRNSVRATVDLGERLSAEAARAERLDREVADRRRQAARSDQLERLVASRTAQLRKAYEDLRGLDQMKDRFLSGLSHEMKSPLTGILGAATLLRDYPSDAERVREGAATIVASARTLDRQLDSLFRVTGIEDPGNPLTLSEVTAEALARLAVDLSGQRNVRCRVSDVHRPMRLDADRLSRALANLIDNAAKFSGGRTVELVMTTQTRTRGRGELTQLSISVLDEAPVIPEQDRHRIFDPFEQGGHPLSGKPAGVGLGLYEARTIARQHGGELEHRPRATRGNEFKLTVPLSGTARARCETVCVGADEGGTR